MKAELKSRLSAFDGVAVTVLSEIRAHYQNIQGFLAAIVDLSSDSDLNISAGATWILKAEVEEGTRFEAKLIAPLLERLDQIENWQAQLHVLQAVSGFDLDESQALALYDWASGLSDHKRPFLRAWSLHARVATGVRLCADLPEDRQSDQMANLQIMLQRAEQDPAASVRARARTLKKELQKIIS